MSTQSPTQTKRRHSIEDTTLDFIRSCDSLMSGQLPVEILRNAKILLTDQRYWTKKAIARDAHGNKVNPCHPSALQFSVEGAIARCSNKYGFQPPFFMALLDSITAEVGVPSSGEFNDLYTHQDVLMLLDTAIHRLEHPSG